MNAISSQSGKIKWQSSSQGLSLGRTGEFYSTPALAFGRVYTGNHDGRVYSFEQKDGVLAWSHSAGGPVIGSVRAVGDTVYVASFAPKHTNGFAMKDGRKVFSYGTGAYTPVISDGHRIYLTGYSSITALQPLTKKQIQGRAKARQQKEARKRKRQADRRKREAQASQRQAKAGKNKPTGKASKGQHGGKGP
jgi:outer membrane protein assembly factor BamB